MVAAGPLQTIKAELTCPICLELFRDPVTSECGHSFCRECITQHCQGDGDVTCPLCNEKLRKGNLRPNRELKNIVESLRSQPVEDPRRGTMCEMHQQPLLLYCQEDQTPICLVCERCRAHRSHTVVPVEEPVQAYWETLTKQLAGIEFTYEKVHPLVSMDWKHLSPSTGKEVHKRLKRLADSTATLFKVDTEGPRQRFEALASQPQPREPDRRGRGRGVATRSELRECQGREPGSEPAAETLEETGSHVVHVCEEAPTPKYGLDQATLDPTVHSISSTRDFEKSKVDVKGQRSRFDSSTFPAPWQVSAGEQASVSPAGQGAAQTESGGDTGPGWEAPEEQEATETPVQEEAAPSRRAARRNPQRHSTIGVTSELSQADAPSRGDSFQGRKPVRSRQHSGRSRQVGVSPGWRVARPPELQGCAVEVTLDPATAHPRLRLSEDRKSAEHGNTWQDLPNNPERFDVCISVLGTEGFTSGRRYWEVEVGPGGRWTIGVARDSVQRKGWIRLKPDFGIWALDSFNISQVPRKVGVYLDYERGQVRFYNAETMALISSLTATFTGILVPFFCLWTVGSRLSLSQCQR